MPCYHSVPENLLVSHSKVCRLVYDEAVHLHKASGVHKNVDSFPRGKLALGVLLFDLLGPAPQPRLGAFPFQLCEPFLHTPGHETGRHCVRIKDALISHAGLPKLGETVLVRPCEVHEL